MSFTAIALAACSQSPKGEAPWIVDRFDDIKVIRYEVPGFDELLPMAQSLVRLLGVYRDWIIPDKGEVQV